MLEDKLQRFDPRDDDAWRARCAEDIASAERFQSHELREVTTLVVARAIEAGAAALALTGSTARRKRTAISDLDYHVVGPRPELRGLSGDVDLYAGSPGSLADKLASGDDFAQWTLRHGCVLFDGGCLRAAATAIVERGLWPDGSRKLDRLPQLVRAARVLLGAEDRDAAQDQVRATLTSGARGLLLLDRTFPLSRAELPQQLRDRQMTSIAEHLEATIYGEPALPALAEALADLEAVTSARRPVAA